MCARCTPDSDTPRVSPLVSLHFYCFLSGFCRSLCDSFFVRCALGPDGVYRYGVSAWLATDWGWSHRGMEAIFKPTTELLCLTGGTWPGHCVCEMVRTGPVLSGVSVCETAEPPQLPHNSRTVTLRNCQSTFFSPSNTELAPRVVCWVA